MLFILSWCYSLKKLEQINTERFKCVPGIEPKRTLFLGNGDGGFCSSSSLSSSCSVRTRFKVGKSTCIGGIIGGEISVVTVVSLQNACRKRSSTSNTSLR